MTFYVSKHLSIKGGNIMNTNGQVITNVFNDKNINKDD